MSLTRKDFIALADELRPIFGDDAEWSADSYDDVLNALCRFMRAQNPKFMEDRWRDYLSKGGK